MPTRGSGGFHQKVFDWFAPLYDLGVWALGAVAGGEERIRGLFLKEASVPKGGTVLEIFAGTATISLMACADGAKVTALDISHGMLAVAREKAKKAGAGIGMVRGTASELPFPDGTFDRVLASMGLHEVDRETALGSIREAFRVLKPGGRLAIMDYHRGDDAAWFFERAFFLFFEGDTAREWVRSDVQQTLSDAGFRNFKRKFYLHRAIQIITAEKR